MCKGYLAPEYATHGQLTEKIDVFSFGVVVLKVISGRKNIDYNLLTNDVYLLVKVSLSSFLYEVCALVDYV
jgi:hypothetical protein